MPTNLAPHRPAGTALFKQAGLALRDDEADKIELADFGLGQFKSEGLYLLTYVNNDRYCAKEIGMLPRQACPEHRHPPVPQPNGSTDPGKQETFRCRFGHVYLYVAGDGTRDQISATLPAGSEPHYTVFHEISLGPGQQYTIPPDTPHWFIAGPDGAVISEFSSPSRDELDIFTDPRIQRVPDA